jgi:hypothetical protein
MAKIKSSRETKDECPEGGGHLPTSASQRVDGRYVYWSYCDKCKQMLSSPHY